MGGMLLLGVTVWTVLLLSAVHVSSAGEFGLSFLRIHLSVFQSIFLLIARHMSIDFYSNQIPKDTQMHGSHETVQRSESNTLIKLSLILISRSLFSLQSAVCCSDRKQVRYVCTLHLTIYSCLDPQVKLCRLWTVCPALAVDVALKRYVILLLF